MGVRLGRDRRSSALSACRNSELSSRVTLASSARTSRSGVTIIGLTSTSDRLLARSTCVVELGQQRADQGGHDVRHRHRRAWRTPAGGRGSPESPASGSTVHPGDRLSGVSGRRRSSMSTPPLVESSTSGCLGAERSKHDRRRSTRPGDVRCLLDPQRPCTDVTLRSPSPGCSFAQLLAGLIDGSAAILIAARLSSRPPACTCALTTTGSRSALGRGDRLSSTARCTDAAGARRPRRGVPRACLPWYSSRSMAAGR